MKLMVQKIIIKVFIKKLEEILDLMAPYQKQSQKVIRLEERPWITKGM